MRSRIASRKVCEKNKLNETYIMQVNEQFVLLVVYLIDSNFAN